MVHIIKSFQQILRYKCHTVMLTIYKYTNASHKHVSTEYGLHIGGEGGWAVEN